MTIPSDITYIALLFALFVVPRALQRFRVPAAITSLALGAVSGLVLGWFLHDDTVHLLASFGIVALFLFAGLEVDVDDLRLNGAILTQHLVVRAILLAAAAVALARVLGLEPRTATLLALALLTPSTGFILDAIHMFGFDDAQRQWVKAKAIATEILALLVLFATLQSTTWERMAVSVGVLGAMILLLPVVFQVFARLVVPFAPRSEFAFLLMIAVICAYVTRGLGVYYLVGAFVVGMAAQRFRHRLPALASEDLLRAVEMFASFFIPFYFFSAGLSLRREDFPLEALLYGLCFLLIFVPLRIGTVALHRRIALQEKWVSGTRIALSMLPTLVFGLVIAGILRDRFAVAPAIFGGLILYVLATTLLPAFFLKRQLSEFQEPHAPHLDPTLPPPESG